MFYADVSDVKRGGASFEHHARHHGFSIPLSNLKESDWLLEPAGVRELIRKVREDFPKLRDWEGVDAYFGIKTGYDAAFFIDTVSCVKTGAIAAG